jgi:hypothetical protein
MSSTYLTTVFVATSVAGLSTTADMNNSGRSNLDGQVHLGTKAVVETAAANRRTPERREERLFDALIVLSFKIRSTQIETMRRWST